MSELDLLKFLQTYGEETELADFSPEELAQKGERAKQFVLEEKNNVVQAEKIINFCHLLCT